MAICVCDFEEVLSMILSAKNALMVYNSAPNDTTNMWLSKDIWKNNNTLDDVLASSAQALHTS